MRIIMIKEILSLALIFLGLHLLAQKFYLYWTTDWYDIGMHFLGGLLVGLLIIAFIQRIHVKEEILNKKLLFISVIFGVLVVALGWELWEIFIGWTDVIEDRADTILDVIMGLVGGTASVLYYYFKYL